MSTVQSIIINFVAFCVLFLRVWTLSDSSYFLRVSRSLLTTNRRQFVPFSGINGSQAAAAAAISKGERAC